MPTLCQKISNMMPKTFPKGLSFEIIKSKLFNLDQKILEPEDEEHVTKFFYKNIQNYRFKNINNEYITKKIPMVVDTFQDLSEIIKFIEINRINKLEDLEALIESGCFR